MSLRTFRSGLSALALVATSTQAFAADAPKHDRPHLIGQAKLEEKLKDPSIRLLDARSRADYDKGHIPGAVWVDFKAVSALSKPATIKDQAAWGKALAALGINSETKSIYIYDANRQHDSSRIWWSLSYAGVPRVGLVNGGFPLWEREKRPVSTEQAAIDPYEHRPNFQASKIIDRSELRQALSKGEAQLLDSRSAEEYRGEKKAQNSTAPAGHIPGAIDLDAYSLVDADGRFLDEAGLKAKVSEAGISSDRPVIVYSQGGNRSALVSFALGRLNIPSRHYVPGFADWAKSEPDSVVAGAEPGKLAGK
ncbi:rhodanese-like domain-containing protein [Isosphaeraceae bacterium EP7]